MTIEKRAEKLLSGPDSDREDIRFFLAQLLQLSQTYGQEFSKAVSRSLVLAFAFAVLSTSKLSEAELMGMKVQDFSAFRLAIPAGVAILMVRAVVALRAGGLIYQVFYEVVKRHLPSWHESGLGSLLTNAHGPLSVDAGYMQIDGTEHPVVHKMNQGVRLAEVLGGLGVVILFQVYAYHELFDDSRISNILASASLVVTIVATAFAVMYLLTQGLVETRRLH